MIKSIDQGGLGILNLRELNQALLGKWRWRLLTPFNLKRKGFVKFNYFRKFKVFSCKLPKGQKIFTWWTRTGKAGAVFKHGLQIKVGNGLSTSFWNDRWLGSKV